MNFKFIFLNRINFYRRIQISWSRGVWEILGEGDWLKVARPEMQGGGDGH